MKISNSLFALSLATLASLLLFSSNVFALDIAEEDYELKLLGKYVFFDNISDPERQSCSTCHDPRTGGTANNSLVNLFKVAVRGANFHTRGTLKPPSNMYATFIRPFDENCGFGPPGTNQACGGNFWNGRAEGRGPDVGGALYPTTATKHIGYEVFQDPGIELADPPHPYTKYFGPVADQALNPFENPVEQNTDKKSVCEHVANSEYAPLYKQAWGEDINCSDDTVEVSAPDANSQPEMEFEISFKRIALAICAWQASKDLNSFSSKRDIALRTELACKAPGDLEPGAVDMVAPYYDVEFCDQLAAQKPYAEYGKFPLVGLTEQENLGHDLFYNRRPIPFAPSAEGGGPPFNVALFPDLPETNCSFCHSDNPGPVGPGPRDDGSELFQLYADDAFHNIGMPKNRWLPKEPGLGGHTGVADGFFKTPTLRNVDKRKHKYFIRAYGHNGWFKSLKQIVHFYNTADVTNPENGKTRCPKHIKTATRAIRKNCWPEPEHPDTAGFGALIGNLGMTSAQEDALVAFMKTLTDTHTATPPPPYVASEN